MPMTVNPRKVNSRAYADGRSSVDGFLTDGWRRVSKRGSVRFHGEAWQHADLLPCADHWVLVQNGDAWGASVDVLVDGYGTSALRRIHIGECERTESGDDNDRG